MNLGGLSAALGNNLLGKKDEVDASKPGAAYLNSSFCNWLKVLLGFVPAFFSFL